jgi:hypothetical protein
MLPLLLAGGAAGGSPAGEVAFVRDGNLVVLYLATGERRIVQEHVSGRVRFGAGGRYVSAGGSIAGGPALPAADLIWEPGGSRAAYVTRRGGVVVWSPTGPPETIVPDGWGAQGVAWSSGGALAIGRAVCRGACGLPVQTAVWVWRDGTLHRLARAPDRGRPLPVGWSRGRVLWWNWPNSGSIAADGVALYANTRHIADSLMYRDYVSVCGAHVAVAAGGDRYAMHGKRILFDGRDVSGDRSRSWVSPACAADGRLVAAASANTVPARIGREHRSIWQLLPVRSQLTRPPAGWTDEYPRLLRDGSVLFVRTRLTSRKVDGKWVDTLRGRLVVLAAGRERQVAELTFVSSEAESLPNYYGHYGWPSLLAVAP